MLIMVMLATPDPLNPAPHVDLVLINTCHLAIIVRVLSASPGGAE